jgi:hypothetical protein
VLSGALTVSLGRKIIGGTFGLLCIVRSGMGALRPGAVIGCRLGLGVCSSSAGED